MSDSADTVAGRVAFVTGGSRGIGRATALALAAAGHRVAVCYSQDRDGATETVRSIEAIGASGLAVRAAVEDAAAVDAAFGEIEAGFGPVEVLVNNAGTTRDGLIARMSDESWNAVIGVNLTGAFHTIRRAVPKMMRARFGRIVNVSSVGAQMAARVRPTTRPPRPGCSGSAGPSPGSSDRAASPVTSSHPGLS